MASKRPVTAVPEGADGVDEAGRLMAGRFVVATIADVAGFFLVRRDTVKEWMANGMPCSALKGGRRTFDVWLIFRWWAARQATPAGVDLAERKKLQDLEKGIRELAKLDRQARKELAALLDRRKMERQLELVFAEAQKAVMRAPQGVRGIVPDQFVEAAVAELERTLRSALRDLERKVRAAAGMPAAREGGKDAGKEAAGRARQA